MTGEPGITCREFVELVTAYLDRGLDASARQRFEEHLASCPGCETYLEQIKEVTREVGRLREEHLSAPVRAHLLDAFRDWKAEP